MVIKFSSSQVLTYMKCSKPLSMKNSISYQTKVYTYKVMSVYI